MLERAKIIENTCTQAFAEEILPIIVTHNNHNIFLIWLDFLIVYIFSNVLMTFFSFFRTWDAVLSSIPPTRWISPRRCNHRTPALLQNSIITMIFIKNPWIKWATLVNLVTRRSNPPNPSITALVREDRGNRPAFTSTIFGRYGTAYFVPLCKDMQGTSVSRGFWVSYLS